MDPIHKNVYEANRQIGAEKNPLMENPDTLDEEFSATANVILNNAVEILRVLVGVHQAAAAIIIQKDWHYVRKYFSMSEKYIQWKDYDAKATGYGIHAWLLHFNRPVRLTQAELEVHPEFKRFGIEDGKHPPMRGWLAAPIIDSEGNNWGLIQVSDKYEGDFTEEDEEVFVRFASLLSVSLEQAWDKRNLAKNNL